MIDVGALIQKGVLVRSSQIMPYMPPKLYLQRQGPNIHKST